jgi:hypothetical protein
MKGQAPDATRSEAVLPCLGLHPSDADPALREQGLAPPDILLKGHAGTPDLTDGHRHGQAIIQTGRLVKAHLRIGHDKHAFARLAHVFLLETQGGQPFGAGALHELQVVAVENDAASVGVFPVNANRVAEMGSSGQQAHGRHYQGDPGGSTRT